MKACAASSQTRRPVRTLPVKQIRSLLRIRASPVAAAPVTKASTSASSGTLAIVRSITGTKRGVASDGLISTAQPTTKAGIASIIDSISGKFHGLMTPATA